MNAQSKNVVNISHNTLLFKNISVFILARNLINVPTKDVIKLLHKFLILRDIKNSTQVKNLLPVRSA
jgi:hypothetical protein